MCMVEKYLMLLNGKIYRSKETELVLQKNTDI